MPGLPRERPTRWNSTSSSGSSQQAERPKSMAGAAEDAPPSIRHLPSPLRGPSPLPPHDRVSSAGAEEPEEDLASALTADIDKLLNGLMAPNSEPQGKAWPAARRVPWL